MRRLGDGDSTWRVVLGFLCCFEGEIQGGVAWLSGGLLVEGYKADWLGGGFLVVGCPRRTGLGNFGYNDLPIRGSVCERTNGCCWNSEKGH